MLKKISLIFMLLFFCSGLLFAIPSEFDINDIQQNSEDSTISYFVFTNITTDQCIIMKETTYTSSSTYRYATMLGNYSDVYNNRETYNYYNAQEYFKHIQ